jgi:flagellar hook assembly protein FlgD
VRDVTTQTVLVNWVNTQFVEVDEDAPISSEFKLHGNYPNPFNPSTKIKFSTEMLSNVTLNVYSLIGEKVYTADQGMMNAGTYDISWYGVDNAGNKVSSGVYFYEIQSNDRIAKGKMLLMK